MKPGPIEVWLTRKNLEVRGMAIHEDETAEITALTTAQCAALNER